MRQKMSSRRDKSSYNLTKKCSFYNETMCPGSGCKEEEECKVQDLSADKSNLCYVLWQNSSDGLIVKLKGCWLGSEKDCVERNRCVEGRKDTKSQLLFCCCSGDLCNQQMYHVPKISSEVTISSEPSTPTPVIHPEYYYPLSIIACTLVPFLIFTLLFLFGYWFYRCRKMPHFYEVPTREESVSVYEYPQKRPLPYKPIQLIEVKATGRFGAVWKARMGNHLGLAANAGNNKQQQQQQQQQQHDEVLIAVKIFPRQDKASWATELEVYQLPKMRHPNILSFLFAEERETAVHYTEYWLATEYHENGSLCDYLKSHLVNYQQLLLICEGIARGLSFLHEETSGNKPAVAHRDFKSKNVILKQDLSPCIADFGLALIFFPGSTAYDTLGQVGTRRYMAPEVLEGAINFSRDGLLRIDMYACGLVLWEVLSRCAGLDGPIGNYMLPFEEEVGQHPTLEDMQEAVCQHKKRPEIKTYWRNNPNLSLICDTIEECWDQDAEARLSASCVELRISSQMHQFI